jgi:hypothetical protein
MSMATKKSTTSTLAMTTGLQQPMEGLHGVDISRRADDNIRLAVAASPNGMVRSPRLPHLKLKEVTDVPY